MSIPNKITQFLKRNKVHYDVVVHPERFTSTATAEAEHVTHGRFAKVVMAKVDGGDVMLVLPASYIVDLFKLTTVLGTLDVRIEKEKEFKDLFPGCEAGAMPLFGRLYHLPCYVDKSIKNTPKIYFNAGTHTESITVLTGDFLRAVKARLGDFAVRDRKK